MRKIALYISLVLIFTIPWETAITVSALGTLTRLIGFAAAGIWLISVLITGKLRKLHLYHILVFLFLLFNVASIFWTVSFDLTMSRVKTYLQLAILTWLLWDLFSTPESLRLALQVFIFGAYLTIASQLINFAAGQTISNYNEGRFSGAGQNAGEFALILSLTLPLAWHLAMTQRPGPGANFLKAANFAYIPMAILATILTASRTSLVTLIPGILYIAISIRKVKLAYRALIFFAVITTFIVLMPLIPQATLERLSTFGDSIAENDLGGRTALWQGTFEIFLDHPFVGIGSDALSASGQLGSFAHNTFLSIMAELGLVGLVLFLGVLFTVVYLAINQPSPYSNLWITVIAIWLVGAFTLTWEYAKPTWLFLNLVVISAGIYHRHEKMPENRFISDGSVIDPDTSVI